MRFYENYAIMRQNLTYEVTKMQAIDAFLQNLMQATAWGMDKPAAYGVFHLGFTFLGLFLSVFLAWKLRNIGEKGKKRCLTICGLFLVITEVYKQLFYFYAIHDHVYPWWIFPFQLCSIPMYLCLIAPRVKSPKIRKALYSFMMTFNLLGGLMAFIEPSGIVHEYWTLTLHAFLWHMLLIFVGLFIGFSNLGGKTMKDYRSAIVTFLVLCCIAFGLNVALWSITGGSMNNFYIGPANSPLAIFNSISANYGWYISTLLYIPAVSLGALVIFLPFHFWHKKKAATLV